MLDSTEVAANYRETAYKRRTFMPAYSGADGTKDAPLPQYTKPRKALITLRAYLNSAMFYVLQAVIALLFVWIRQEVLGAVFFGLILVFNLVVCEDIRATTLPFMLICTITTNCYDSYYQFIVFAKYAPIALVCIIYHFVVYPKEFVMGDSAKGIFAVGLAVCLGGLGRFSIDIYIHGAYYFFALGFGMYLVYFLLRSQFDEDTEEAREKFAFLMTILALVCFGMIANGYYKIHVEDIEQKYVMSRNNLSTILMFCMPFPLYLAKRWKFSPILCIFTLAALSFTGSRGGFIFGCIEFATCAAFWVFSADSKKRKKLRLILLLVIFALAVIALFPYIYKIISGRFEKDIKEEIRFSMLLEAIEKFLKRPLSGYGLLDSDIAYETVRKKGSLTWYHMMVPQVLGGMGLIGVFCYGYQCIGRFRLILTKYNAWSLVLGISYLGILMMSQVNPGEFVPLPFEFLTVLLFVLQETRLQTTRPLYKQASFCR